MRAYARVSALAGKFPRWRETSAPDLDQLALAAQAMVAILDSCRFLLYLPTACCKGCDRAESNLAEAAGLRQPRVSVTEDSGMLDVYRE